MEAPAKSFNQPEFNKVENILLKKEYKLMINDKFIFIYNITC